MTENMNLTETEQIGGARCKTAGLFPGCRDCLLALAESAAEMTAAAPDLRRTAVEEGRTIIEASLRRDVTSPELANEVMRAMRRVTGVDDPYLEYKLREMDRAKQEAAGFSDAEDLDLKTCLALAALGNSLDFFRPAEAALSGAAEKIAGDFAFQHDDSEKLAGFLIRRPGLILYLTDNAGEIFFDLPLYRRLRRHAARVVLVVKGGPALNDLTRADLERAHLVGQFDQIADTGADGAGVDWNRVSPEFLELLGKADLVISKGMANFETLYAHDLEAAVFFLFKVKCTPIRDFLKAPAESFQAIWKEGSGRADGQHAQESIDRNGVKRTSRM